MTKAELVSALEWFKDDVELHIVVPHEALDKVYTLMGVDQVRWNLIPSRVEIVARYPDQATPDNGRGPNT